MLVDRQSPFLGSPRSHWVRVQTLTRIRWLAVVGQLAALATAYALFDLALAYVPLLLVIGASALANLLADSRFPENHRLTERQALGLLTYDLAQLSLLLALAGGLTNPFAVLILAPVTISAAALEMRSTLVLGATAVLFASGLALWGLPVVLPGGQVFAVPPLFRFGFWVSLVVAVLFIGGYSRRVAEEIRAMSDALLAAQMALSAEQKLTDLGGVVAAAAHELGTPLATIKLVASELVEDLTGDQAEDAQLILSQADRCRDILHSMGRAGKDDLLMRRAPLLQVLHEAAAPHLNRGKPVEISAAQPLSGQPLILRRPEIIHGLRNLIQNAVDFAAGSVRVTASWTAQDVLVEVVDDGPGYPPQIIGRIGNPFLRARTMPASARPDQLRPGYEGMGLGLFIARTLLERTGAGLAFANGAGPAAKGPHTVGARVTILWPRARIESLPDQVLGQNPAH